MAWVKKLALLACIVSITAATGCTGTDVLSTGNTDFTISVEIVNPETRHDIAFFAVSAINVRPNEPNADASLGPKSIGIIATEDDIINVNLNDLSDFDPTTIRLSTGSYRINRIEISGTTFFDFEAPLPAPSCQELFSYPPLVPVPITAADLGDPNVLVTEGGGGTLTIVIDATAMVDAFEAAFTSCNLASGSATSNQFRPSLFAGAAPSYIRLE